MASNGLAPRTERLLILVAGLAVAGLGYQHIALPIAMGLIALLAWITVVQRIVNVRNQAAAAATSTPIGTTNPSDNPADEPTKEN
jgi:CDP-diacylglycerol--glycerol-3-phosphate 3-phosphatidyltransferase